jgi:DNA-binding transcriptional LysR family regulator
MPNRRPPLDPLATRVKGRQLALVVALDARRSLRQAAADVAVTQPAATKLLRDLEDALGATLFDRHAWGMSPTPYGEAMIRYAHGILTDLDGAREEISALAAGARGVLRVGSVTGAVPHLVAPAIRAVRESRPGLRIRVLVNASEVLAAALRQGTLDVAVGPRPPDDDLAGLEAASLAEEPLTVVARAGHPLSRRRQGGLAQLAGAPWIVPPPGGPLRRDFDALHAAPGRSPPPDLIETVSIVATLALLQDSEAVSLLPVELARHYEKAGMLSRLPIALPGTDTRYELLTRANRQLAPGALAFVDRLRDAARAAPVRRARR